MNLKEKVAEIKEYIKEMNKLNQALTLAYWDMQTEMPKNAVDSRSELVQYLSGKLYEMQTSDKVMELINEIKPFEGGLSVVEKRMIEELARAYDETNKIPQDRYIEYVGLCSKSEKAWEEAKEKNDFNIFKPYLKQVIDFQKEFIEYWGYEDCKYDTLLDKYERGLKVKDLDIIFKDLRDGIIDILNKVKNSPDNVKGDFLIGNFDKDKQKDLSISVLKTMGFNFDSGVIAESVHPFTTELCNKDIRITTNYLNKDITSALYSSIHEGGHAIYEQNISDDLINTGLETGVSMGIHESQSRFYENIIGRSREFCAFVLPEIQKRFSSFKNVSLDDYYRAVNYIEPSLIRTEADELTYALHVIIRYEIEKELINGEVDIEKLPELWNKKYKEYLGVEPGNDAEGILQDMHWSDGSFGYFPSYALGNLYGAQMYYKLLSEQPNVMHKIEKGDFSELNNWLKEKVHKHGSVYKPGELIKNITGEELNSKYFLKYLREKYL